MHRREVVIQAITHRRPPYVPWDICFSGAGRKPLERALGVQDLEEHVGNHFAYLGSSLARFEEMGDGLLRDAFGAIWRRNDEGDPGIVVNKALPEPTLSDYRFPEADDPSLYSGLEDALARHRERFRIFAIGYTLFERAWALRGMEDILTDLALNPEFVHELLDRLTEVHLAQVRRALELPFDCVHFGDDWGHQRGLFFSPAHWREFIKPRLARLFTEVKSRGRFVSVHSCGDVHELFDDLVEIGLDIANPFQPEAMDIHGEMSRLRGRLAFHGGLSAQQTLPMGTPDDIRRETEALLRNGAGGGYVFAPAHGVGPEVPVENTVAMIETLMAQKGLKA